MPGPAEAVTAAEGAVESSRPRILYLAKQFPWPTNVGSRQRAFHVVRGLARAGDVVLAALDDPPPPGEQDAFRAAAGVERLVFVSPATSLGARPQPRRSLLARAVGGVATTLLSPVPEMVRYWWSPKMVETLAELRRREAFDVVYAAQSWMAEHARAAGFARIVVDVDDLVSALSWQEVRRGPWSARTPLDALRAWREHAWERSLPRRFTRVVVAKDADRGFFPAPLRHRVRVLPNGIRIPPHRQAEAELDDTLLFVGTLGYAPNADAIAWFAREVMPLLWRARPGARFQVAGFGTADHLHGVLADPRCPVAESPPELAPFYARAAVVVAPVRIGGGTRIKILEALAYGKAVVSTRFAAEGLGLRDGVEVEFADTAAEMAARCLALLGDPARRRALGEAGHRHVAERFDWAKIEERVGEMLPEAAIR